MNATCPRCHETGISQLAKRWSNRAAPATCKKCGGLSHVVASASSWIGVGTVLGSVTATIAAVGTGSYLVAMVGLLLLIAFNIRAWQFAELVPIPQENVDAEKTANWFLAGIGLLLALFG